MPKGGDPAIRLLMIGVFNLGLLALLNLAGAIFFINREKVLEALSCMITGGLTGWLSFMIIETLKGG